MMHRIRKYTGCFSEWLDRISAERERERSSRGDVTFCKLCTHFRDQGGCRGEGPDKARLPPCRLQHIYFKGVFTDQRVRALVLRRRHKFSKERRPFQKTLEVVFLVIKRISWMESARDHFLYRQVPTSLQKAYVEIQWSRNEEDIF